MEINLDIARNAQAKGIEALESGDAEFVFSEFYGIYKKCSFFSEFREIKN
jgi:hypothetical protein